MKPSATIIGNFLSPYVRKVAAVCALKRVAFEVDPIVPFFGNDRFSALSPLRRIPVFIDDQVTLSDSSVICQYLEDRFPDPPVYPSGIADRARARFIEEYADTRIGDVFIWGVFNEARIKPFVWGQPRDLEKIAAIIRDEVPGILHYLERLAPAEGFSFGPLSIADISVAVFFSNLRWARADLDMAPWPRTRDWIARVLAEPAMLAVTSVGDAVIKTPLDQQRAVYPAFGYPVTAETVAGEAPRRGPMTA